MTEIRSSDYRVWHDEAAGTVFFEGSMRLRHQEYDPLWRLLLGVLDQKPATFTLDLHGLSFLNSSGINTLYRLAVAMRKRGGTQLVVRGGAAAWQQKSLPNLTRFLPGCAVSFPAATG